MLATGIRGDRCVKNDVILSPNRVPWCRLRGYGVGGTLRTKQCKARGTEGKYSKSKQSTLVPATGIRGGRYVKNKATIGKG